MDSLEEGVYLLLGEGVYLLARSEKGYTRLLAQRRRILTQKKCTRGLGEERTRSLAWRKGILAHSLDRLSRSQKNLQPI